MPDRAVLEVVRRPLLFGVLQMSAVETEGLPAVAVAAELFECSSYAVE